MTTFATPSPKSILGKVGYPNKNCRVMDGLLSNMHKAMAVQTKLANAILLLLLWELVIKLMKSRRHIVFWTSLGRFPSFCQ